jgi:hypothetical protein
LKQVAARRSVRGMAGFVPDKTARYYHGLTTAT